MKVLALLALLFALTCPVALHADDAESQIKAVLNTQLEDWNRGDIPAFMTTYAPDCIFVGKQVARGRDQVLARYQKNYPTREAMGHLTFSDLEVHLMSPDLAIVIGGWHLDRTSNSVGGLFSLVFRRSGKEWKIALDHTS